MIILKHAKFIYQSRIYKPGEVLPDTCDALSLVERGLAEVVNSEKPVKTAKKKAQSQPIQPVQPQPVQTPQPEQGTQIVQNTQENAQGNT